MSPTTVARRFRRGVRWEVTQSAGLGGLRCWVQGWRKGIRKRMASHNEATVTRDGDALRERARLKLGELRLTPELASAPVD